MLVTDVRYVDTQYASPATKLFMIMMMLIIMEIYYHFVDNFRTKCG